MNMRKLDISSSVFWLAFALFAGGTGIHLGLGSLRQPGPGFTPFTGAMIIAVCAVITLLQALRETQEKEGAAGDGRSNWKRGVYLLFSCFVYAIALDKVGFLPCTFLFFLFFLRVVIPATWWRAILVSTIVSIVTYLLFNGALDSGLPKGFLGL